MSHIQQILVPIDFSDCAPSVVRSAAKLGAQLDATVTLLHAMTAPKGIGEDVMITPPGGTEQVTVYRYLYRSARAKLPFYNDIIESEGAKFGNAVVEMGDPTVTILAATEARKVDLIVMGTHGRVGVRRLLVGSVAESVLRESNVPVMITRAQYQPHCEASSCATCTSHISNEMAQVNAEVDG